MTNLRRPAIGGRIGCRVLVGVLLLGGTTFAADEEVHLGWGGQSGVSLASELKCAACHSAPKLLAEIPEKVAPKLKDVGQRVTPQYLLTWLGDPQAVKPGSAMPDVLHGLPAGEKRQATTELTHYLVSLSGPIEQSDHGGSLFDVASGRDLYHSVGCVACHKPFEPPPAVKDDPYAGLDAEDLAELDLPDRSDPWTPIPHGDLASKYTLASLAEFLQNPSHARPSGRMPSLVLDRSESLALAAYLLRDQMTDDESGVGPGLDREVYQGKFGSVSQITNGEQIHVGSADGFDIKDRPFEVPDGPTLKDNFGVRFSGLIVADQAGEYRFQIKSDDGSQLSVAGKPVATADGVHPPMTKEGGVTLQPGRHPIEVLFFEVGGGHELTVKWKPPGENKWQTIPQDRLLHATTAFVPTGRIDFVVDQQLAAAGKRRFETSGCVQCHSLDAKQQPMLLGQPLAELDFGKATGCVGPSPSKKAADYAVSREQAQSIEKDLPAFLAEDIRSDARSLADRTLSHRMQALNCYACHPRNEVGGVDITRANYFTTLVPVDLGDEGRLPPPLNETGAKLTDAGFADTFKGGSRYRSYMATRMPKFNDDLTGPIIKLFRDADAGKIEPHAVPELTKERAKDGWFLTGKTGLGCVNCHQWGDRKLLGAEGLDFLKVPGRIRPEWFHAFLKDPQQLKPRTRMPTIWRGDATILPEVADGKRDPQIDAIWAYLSTGQKYRVPVGLEGDASQMILVRDEPVLFRTFLSGVGAKAITVGYPERVNLAFDGLRCRLSVVWSGAFISTQKTWEGRAGQYTGPAGKSVYTLPAKPHLARLASQTEPWPSPPDDKRMSPEGWSFLGYAFDAQRNPIFRYRYGSVTVEEHITGGEEGFSPKLTRELTFKSDDAPGDLYLLLGSDEKIEKVGRRYVLGERMKIETTGDAFPTVRDSAGGKELVAPVRFKNGEARVRVVMTWE